MKHQSLAVICLLLTQCSIGNRTGLLESVRALLMSGVNKVLFHAVYTLPAFSFWAVVLTSFLSRCRVH